MKKIFSLLLGALMSVSVCLPALAACDGGDGQQHEHTVASWTQTHAPTCTEAGEKSGVCTECGETVTQPVPALGHTILDKNIRELVSAATCTEEGVRIVWCPVCGQEVEDKIGALGHAWENEAINLTEPTCTEEGSVNAKCSRCGTEAVRSVPALGHAWEDFFTIETSANFEHDGKKYRACSRCDQKTDETVIPKLDPNEVTQYQLRLVRNSGDVIKLAGVGYEIFNESGASVGTGSFRNGTAMLPLKPATYTVKLTAVPKGYTAQESYTVSWENLVADITLTAKLVMDRPDTNTKYSVGSVMNDLTFNTIKTNAKDAETLTLSGLLETHKIVVLNFWDTSCSFCKYEFPGLNEAYALFKDDVAVIAVDDPDGVGDEETEEQVRAYADRKNLNFHIMMDGDGLAEMFNVSGYPVTVVIDCEGAVCYIHDGALVNPKDYDDTAYSKAQFTALFKKYIEAPYYHD